MLDIAKPCAKITKYRGGYMVRVGETNAERTLIRTIAGSARPLEEDLKLSSLQAIDRLQKLQEKFREQWVGQSPCLVLKDGWILPNGPIEKMLGAMDKHGDPVGMVGIAWLTHSKRVGILQMLFRSKADKKAIDVVKRAANEALIAWQDYVKGVDLLKGRDKTE
jgi:hypothetical protein